MLWVRGPLRFLSGIERPGNTGGVTVATGRGEDRVRVGAFRTPGRGSCIAWSLDGDARAGCSHPASAPSRPAVAGARSWPAPGLLLLPTQAQQAGHSGRGGARLGKRETRATPPSIPGNSVDNVRRPAACVPTGRCPRSPSARRRGMGDAAVILRAVRTSLWFMCGTFQGNDMRQRT